MVKKNTEAPSGPKAVSEWAMISASEAYDQEVKYLARLADVSVSAELVKSADRDFYQQEIARAKAEEWDHFLRCDGLPRPNRPVEVRTFIAKMRHFDEIESNSSLDWTLSVDDRSVLNQNIFRVDKTRRVVELTKDSPGTYYDANVRMCLDTLKQMDVMLDNEAEMDHLTKAQQNAIMDVYTEVQFEIEQLLNRLAYRVLKMQGSYMDSEDGRIAYWSFKGNRWEMDLWGLRNVPIRFKHLDLPVMLAKMKASGVEVQIPTSVLSDCLTLRCVHTDFDNVSHKAKSFDPAVIDSANYPNAGIVDILESIQNEWAMQEDIRSDTLAILENRRVEYEETMRLIAERTEQAAKAAKQNSGNESKINIIIPKTPKEPLAVQPGMVPDVYKDFIKMEEKEYAGFLDEIYHPRHLEMREFEINLRECIMLGGIFSVLVIRRPEQTQFEKFNIIQHEDGRVLFTMPNLKTNVESERRSSVARTTVEDYRDSSFKLAEDDLPYFIVTLQLPADLCKWSQPQVCQFISEKEISRHHSRLRPSGSDYISPIRTSQPRGNSILSQSSKQTSIWGSVELSNIFRPSIRSLLRHSKFEEDKTNVFSLDNFSLLKPLEHDETRKLQRLCIPRIISSFKLPRDMLDEVTEVEVPKGGLCRLVKRPEAEETKPQQEETRDFTFEDQNDPERLFPIFPYVEPIGYPYANEEHEPEALFDHTAMGLLKKLDYIKGKYVGRANQLWNQREIVDKKDKKGTKTPARAIETAPVEEEPAEKTPTSKTHKHGEVKVRSTSKSQDIPETLSEETMEMQDVTHWTTKYINDASLDPATHRITFKTDRLGIFGLAFKRYEHFPFRDWSMQPNEENPDEIIFTVDTFHVRIFFYITTQGVRGYVTDLSKAYTANPVKYLVIEEPISDFGQLRKLFISKNINIFAQNDASYYIENGYFSMKHVAAEHHTYNIMGLHCKLMKFYRSSWNRLAKRRDIIVNMKIAKDTSDYSEVTLRITPEKTTFVQVSENCSDEVNVIVLSYTETWRNISNFTDMHQAVTSMVFNATELRNKDTVLFNYVTRMLKELRPLSFA
ncbi:hypothetical protein KR059_002675 [Drosophila kikkawai]|nr:hypothetical protein KR059_002675 [Drosophila kikkawai]